MFQVVEGYTTSRRPKISVLTDCPGSNPVFPLNVRIGLGEDWRCGEESRWFSPGRFWANSPGRIGGVGKETEPLERELEREGLEISQEAWYWISVGHLCACAKTACMWGGKCPCKDDRRWWARTEERKQDSKDDFPRTSRSLWALS